MGKVSADLQVNGKSNGQGKRSRIEIDADGDVVMGQEPKQRGNRGGKSLRRKKRRGLDGGDIEMEDVEVCCLLNYSSDILQSEESKRPEDYVPCLDLKTKHREADLHSPISPLIL